MEYLMVTNWGDVFNKVGEKETKYDVVYLKKGITKENINENTICTFVNTRLKKAFKGLLLNITKKEERTIYFKYKIDSELIYEEKFNTKSPGWYLVEAEAKAPITQVSKIIEEVKQIDEKEKLIEDFYEIVKDYRADEGDSTVLMSIDRISKWINQFKEEEQEFLLKELVHIFSERYFSKNKVELFLVSMIDKLTVKFEYSSSIQFLSDTVFLDLQPDGKSQKVILGLLGELLKSKYSFDIKNCGKNSKKYFIYLDDILCTGNTLFYDIKKWASESYNEKLLNVDAIKSGNANLMLVYIFSHTKNYQKKLKEIEIKIDKEFSNKIHIGNRINIHNYEIDENSTLDLLFPLEKLDNAIVIKYKEKIVEQVNEHTKKNNYTTKDEFYRKKGMPVKEILFTSTENRIRFENIILAKGIEILCKAKTNKINIRALGFALPSQKNFGFGTLCFTWRNIPNNTPLVFWYLGGGFFPLFVKKKTH